MTIILVGVLLVLVIAAFIFLKIQGKEEPAQGAYVSRGALMTPAEQEFFRVLRSSLPIEHYQIFSKVRMADIVDVKKGMEKKSRTRALNRIISKHVDFLLCNPIDSSIYAVVELDDSSHNRQSQKRNDAFKNETFAACAIPLVRFPVKASYSPEEIAAQINSAFGR
ncbi:MAG: DUF2726 domain-containing protein [Verrucomicrobia subdivision 3 bacterium]|nr:DUF2726 domain-containing protein [Limisphaerales bacterium]